MASSTGDRSPKNANQKSQSFGTANGSGLAAEGREGVTIESLLKAGAIVGHKDGNYGSYYPRASEFGTEGIPFLTAKSLNNGRIDIDGAPRLSEKRANELPFGFVQPGDVLLSHNATVGRVAVVPEFSGRLLIGTSLTYFRVDTTKLSPRYLAAYFSGTDFQHELVAVMSHSTRNQVPVSAQRSLKIIVPSLAEQVTIADILSTFDDNIERCRRMNNTLAEMAQAIFKSWFVDFDPVRANAEGREPDGMDAETAGLFPSDFEESELGELPAGWHLRPAGDLMKQARGSINPLRHSDMLFAHYSLPAFDESRRPKMEYGRDIKSNKTLIPERSILLSKLNPHIPRIWLPSSTLPENAVCSTEFLVFQPADRLSVEYLYCQFTEQGFAKRFGGLTTGTSNSHQRVKVEYLLEEKLIDPNPRVVEAFTSLTRPMFEKINANLEGQQTLSDLRDTLLPRLISGKLRVPDAEKLVEAVL